MAEYTGDWSQTKVEEFYGYDMNHDGFITPGEVLGAEKAKAKAAKEVKSSDRKSGTESKDARAELPKGPFGPPPPGAGWGRGPGFGPPPPGPPSKDSSKEPSKEAAKEPGKEPQKEVAKETTPKESSKEPSKDNGKGPSKDSRDRRPGWGRR